MDKKVGMESFFIAIGTICALTLTLGVVCAADIFVGPSETYTSIQLAVTAANASDTIIVRDNTYTENININKSLMIYSENGSENCIVTALNPNDHVFNVTADWVNITGFTVQNATGDDMAGIFLDDVMNCTISNNNATNNFHGIWLYNCGYGQKGNILLNNNTAYANIGWGIYLSLSNGNNITKNTCAYNGFAGDYSYDGIGLEDSNDNIISKNNCSSNAWAGIYLGDYSSNNNVTSNTCSDNQQGIQIRDASNNVFTNNTVSNNVYGIYLYPGSNNNTLTDNTATSNYYYNIHLEVSNNNTFTNNTASFTGLMAGAIRADTGTYKVVYFSFGFEGINNATMRDTVMNRTIKWLSPSLTENVLLVDDDEGAAYETYYNGSLINNGIGYDYWNTSSQGSPTSANLSSYPVVIWFTGDAGTLTSTEQYELEGYLNAGGNLFLTGQDIGYDLIMNGNDDGVFYSNYLHATFVMDNANKYALAGMAGDPISDGLVIGISDGDGAGNQEWPSGILPGENATTVFYYVPPDASIGNNISCNLVHHNTYCGFFLTGESTGNTIEYNNIIANGIYNGTSYGYEYNFYNNQSDNVEAKYNWWGTAVSSEIAASINADPGTVDYDSFLIAPAECAPSEAPQFCIEIEKQINGVNYVTATPGETLEVTLWINNCGTVNLTNLSVRDNFPLKQSNAGLSYANISDPVGLEISGIFEGWIDDDLVWNNLTQFEPLQPRENFTITFEATVDELAKGLLENCATVNANYTIPGQVSVTVNDTDCATVSVSSPEVSEVPILTPTGLVALASLLSAIAAVALVRKRR
jgi:parallel beta-helix repeat protein